MEGSAKHAHKVCEVWLSQRSEGYSEHTQPRGIPSANGPHWPPRRRVWHPSCPAARRLGGLALVHERALDDGESLLPAVYLRLDTVGQDEHGVRVPEVHARDQGEVA